MTLDLSRRGLIGMLAAGAGAAIIRTPGLLMPIKPLRATGKQGTIIFETNPLPGDTVTINGQLYEFRNNPVLFVRTYLPFELTKWQIEVIDAMKSA